MASQQHDQRVVEAQPPQEIITKMFANMYYQILLNHTKDAWRLYRETSIVGRPEPDGALSFVTTLQDITNKLKSVHHNWNLEVIKTIDFYTSDGSMLVRGCMVLKDDSIKKDFVQSLFFTQESGCFILHDIFRFTGNSSAQIVTRNPLPKQDFSDRVEEQIREEDGECSTKDETPPVTSTHSTTTISQLITKYRVKVPRKFSAIFTIYTSLWVLVSVAFIPQDVGMPIARIVMDIVAGLICFLAIFDEHNNKAICVVNILSILPLAMPYILERFHLHMVPARIPVFLVCYSLQICRLQAVRFAFIEAEKYSTWSYTVIGCAKILLVNFFLLHSPACFFYCLSKVTGDTWIVGDSLSRSIFRLYGNAFYWSVTTFMSVGFGDVTPKKMWDKVCVGMYMFTNILSYSYVAGCITNIIVAENIKMIEFRRRSGFLRRLLDMDGSPYIRRQIIRHLELEHLTSCEQIGDNQNINSLPEALGEEFKVKIAHILRNDGLFHGVPTSVLYELISEMYSVYLCSKDVIIKFEAKPTHLFLLLHGSVDIIRAGQSRRVSGRNLFGIQAFITNVVHQESIQTYNICHMVKVDRSSFFKVIRGNPGIGKIILDNFCRIHADLVENIDSRIHMGILDDYLTVSNAIELKDWALARRLIIRGIDNGRCTEGSTPLIDATRKQNIDIVHLLLTHGAPPNVTDIENGNTALHYAMYLNNLEICELLIRYGADDKLENNNDMEPVDMALEENHYPLISSLYDIKLE